ncbi:MAG: class I SAM-dependent methyltransferase [Aminipila sp.]
MENSLKNFELEEIFKCQNEICKLDGNSYYLNQYKNSEISYWSHIPQWIYEDNRQKKVTNCLDIGCAYGTLALYCKKLFNCNVYCTDFIDVHLSKTLINYYNFLFSINNIELDPFPWEEKFDVIIFTEVLEHLNFHPLPTLKKIHSLLKDDGCLYLSTPDALSWGKITTYYPSLADIPYPNKDLPLIDTHIYIYDKKEILDVLNEAGFRIKRFAYSTGHTGAKHFNLTLTKWNK